MNLRVLTLAILATFAHSVMAQAPAWRITLPCGTFFGKEETQCINFVINPDTHMTFTHFTGFYNATFSQCPGCVGSDFSVDTDGSLASEDLLQSLRIIKKPTRPGSALGDPTGRLDGEAGG